jgi:hypothetical protein
MYILTDAPHERPRLYNCTILSYLPADGHSRRALEIYMVSFRLSQSIYRTAQPNPQVQCGTCARQKMSWFRVCRQKCSEYSVMRSDPSLGCGGAQWNMVCEIWSQGCLGRWHPL